MQWRRAESLTSVYRTLDVNPPNATNRLPAYGMSFNDRNDLLVATTQNVIAVNSNGLSRSVASNNVPGSPIDVDGYVTATGNSIYYLGGGSPAYDVTPPVGYLDFYQGVTDALDGSETRLYYSSSRLIGEPENVSGVIRRYRTDTDPIQSIGPIYTQYPANALAVTQGGGVIVASGSEIRKYNRDGAYERSFDVPGVDNWYALATSYEGLNPFSFSFYAAAQGSRTVYRFRFVNGNASVTPFDVGTFAGINSLAVKDAPGYTETLKGSAPPPPSNRAPIIYQAPSQNVSVGQTISVPIKAEAVDSDTVTLTASNLPRGAGFSAASSDKRAQGTFTWTPDSNEPGNLRKVTFTATDGAGRVSQRFVTFNVLNNSSSGITYQVTPPHQTNGGTSFNITASSASSPLSLYRIQDYPTDLPRGPFDPNSQVFYRVINGSSGINASFTITGNYGVIQDSYLLVDSVGRRAVFSASALFKEGLAPVDEDNALYGTANFVAEDIEDVAVLGIAVEDDHIAGDAKTGVYAPYISITTGSLYWSGSPENRWIPQPTLLTTVPRADGKGYTLRPEDVPSREFLQEGKRYLCYAYGAKYNNYDAYLNQLEQVGGGGKSDSFAFTVADLQSAPGLVVTIDNPKPGSTVTSLPVINGFAAISTTKPGDISPTYTDVADVQVSLQRSSDGFYWDIPLQKWVSTPTSIRAAYSPYNAYSSYNHVYTTRGWPSDNNLPPMVYTATVKTHAYIEGADRYSVMSSRFTVNRTGPSVSVTKPMLGASYNSLPFVEGTSSSNGGSSIAKITTYLLRLGAGRNDPQRGYWNGLRYTTDNSVNWQPTYDSNAELPATQVNGSWDQWTFALPTPAEGLIPGLYEIRPRAVNSAGLAVRTDPIRFIVDNAGPRVTITSPVSGAYAQGQRSLSTITGTAEDSGGVASVQVIIQRNDGSRMFWTGSSWETLLFNDTGSVSGKSYLLSASLGTSGNPASTTWSCTGPSDLDLSRGKYTIIVICYDKTGNQGRDVSEVEMTNSPAISAPWRALDVATGRNNKSLLLWATGTTPNCLLEVWTVNSLGVKEAVSSVQRPASPGWTPKAIAVGSDFKSRILWNNSDGRVSIWTMNTLGVLESAGSYPALSGYTALDLAVDASNKIFLLWGDGNGRMQLQRLSSAYAVEATSPMYGTAASGWNARAVSIGGDGMPRVMWNHIDRRWSLWTMNYGVNSDLSPPAAQSYPARAFVATDIAVDSNSKTRLMYVGAQGQLQVQGINSDYTTDSISAIPVHGPFAGVTPTAISVGADRKPRALWNASDGRAFLWRLTTTGAKEASAEYPLHP